MTKFPTVSSNYQLVQTSMDNIKNLILALAGVAVIATCYLMVNKSDSVPQRPVGAVSSPEIQSPYIRFGGVIQWAQHTDGLLQATTTLCALQSPSSTSTLLMGGISIVQASSSNAVVVDIAKATGPNSTTTLLGAPVALAAGAGGTVLASTTGMGTNNPAYVFAPNTYLVIAMKGGLGGVTGSVPTGACSAVWAQF